MKIISDFFNKFLKINHNSEYLKLEILKVVKDILKIEIPHKDIELRGENLMFKCSPIIRCEIFQKKEEVINKLSSLGIKIRKIS